MTLDPPRRFCATQPPLTLAPPLSLRGGRGDANRDRPRVYGGRRLARPVPWLRAQAQRTGKAMSPPDILLTDQVAVVTGAGGGIGRGIALALAGAGADIVVADKISERCETVAAQVRALGRRAV